MIFATVVDFDVDICSPVTCNYKPSLTLSTINRMKQQQTVSECDWIYLVASHYWREGVCQTEWIYFHSSALIYCMQYLVHQQYSGHVDRSSCTGHLWPWIWELHNFASGSLCQVTWEKAGLIVQRTPHLITVSDSHLNIFMSTFCLSCPYISIYSIYLVVNTLAKLHCILWFILFPCPGAYLPLYHPLILFLLFLLLSFALSVTIHINCLKP